MNECKPVKMVVTNFVQNGLFGFCEDGEGNQVFFHASRFYDTVSTHRPPELPVAGEEVIVVAPGFPGEYKGPDSAPKAFTVSRLNSPKRIKGVISSYNPHKELGFISGDDGESYFLSSKEVLTAKSPREGMRVSFIPGMSHEKLRACLVDIESPPPVWGGSK